MSILLFVCDVLFDEGFIGQVVSCNVYDKPPKICSTCMATIKWQYLFDYWANPIVHPIS